MPVKIGKHLFDSISAKRRVVCKKKFNESIQIHRAFAEQIMSVPRNKFLI